jgi:hypothetical protein
VSSISPEAACLAGDGIARTRQPARFRCKPSNHRCCRALLGDQGGEPFDLARAGAGRMCGAPSPEGPFAPHEAKLPSRRRILRIDRRSSAPLLAGVALGAMMVAAWLGGLAIGRASTQGLRPAGVFSAAAESFCGGWR